MENPYRSPKAERASNPKLDLESRNLKFFREDIFHVPYEELGNSSNYRHLRHVFLDEDDYDDFKTDLLDFHRLRSWKDDRKKVSKERKSRTSPRNTGFEESFEEFTSPFHRFNSSAVEGIQEEPILEFKDIDAHQFRKSLFKAASREKLYSSREKLNQPPMMEFFQNDEHFQEFDRVFETFKNNRFSNNSLDKYRWSPNPEEDTSRRRHDGDVSDSGAAAEGCAGDKCEQDSFDDLQINDIFSDFFDTDVDFMNFEQEFQKFQNKRRSTLALDKINRNSVVDLIDDLKAFCDTDDDSDNGSEAKKCDQLTTPKDVDRLSLPQMWNSGGEWDYIFNKIRRHGKLASESSDTGRSDLTVTFDDQSGNNLLDDLQDSSNRDTGYYSEAKGVDTDECSCTSHFPDCQFTCHHKCLPQITLECKTVSHVDLAEDEGTVCAEETSLTDLNNDSSQSSELSSEPATEKDETDSGYRSGTIPDEKLPRKPSQATLNREELRKRISEFNRLQPGANFALKEALDSQDSNEPAFQGFIKVTLNLVRPINMSLGARPPSIYEVLTKEHIIEQNTQNISFYMPRDTVRSIHAQSSHSTKTVVAMLLKKFHILDHPRKFALYEQELKKHKIVKLRRVKDDEYPLTICLDWDTDDINDHRLVLQENETGEIEWEAFSAPELKNFMRVLDREEEEHLAQLQYKYKVMKRLILQRMKELRKERERQKRASAALDDHSLPAT